MTSSPDRVLAGAAIVFTIALFAFGRALVGALVLDTGSVAPLPPYAPFDSASAARDAPGLDTDALMLAVENDPFRPDRTRPPLRYRLPGDEEMLPPAPPPLPPAPDFRLGGTVVFAGGGMALIEVGEDEERLVHVGEAVSGYRLSGVTAGAAVLENPFRTLTLAVAGPEATRADDDDDDDDDDDERRRGNRRDADDREEAVQRSLMLQIMQRVRQGGASRQQLEAIERVMRGADSPREMMEAYQRFMRSSGGNVEVAPVRVIPRERPAPPAASTRRVPPPNR